MTPDESINHPVSVAEWPGMARLSGAYLLSAVNLQFIDSLCQTFATNLNVASQAVQLLESTVSNFTSQVKEISFLALRVENSIEELIEYLDNELFCQNDIMKKIWKYQTTIHSGLNKVWSKMINLEQKSTRRRRSYPIPFVSIDVNSRPLLSNKSTTPSPPTVQTESSIENSPSDSLISSLANTRPAKTPQKTTVFRNPGQSCCRINNRNNWYKSFRQQQ